MPCFSKQNTFLISSIALGADFVPNQFSLISQCNENYINIMENSVHKGHQAPITRLLLGGVVGVLIKHTYENQHPTVHMYAVLANTKMPCTRHV